MALGAAAKIASIAAQVDSDDPNRINSAEAFVLYGHSFCAYGMEPIKSLKSAASAQNGTVSQVINCGNEHFTGCQVGDQNAYFVQTQAAVTCETISRSLSNYGESLVSYSKAAFYSSDGAFRTMRVTTRNLQ